MYQRTAASGNPLVLPAGALAPVSPPPASDGGSQSDLLVQKFGGSSVANADAIKRVARRIMDTHQSGHRVVVVVSAMGDTTDELLDLAAAVADLPAARELDLLLTTGERISTELLAIALTNLGAVTRTFTGGKTGLITDDVHGKAHVVDVDARRIRAAVDKGEIAIVAGFQGKSRRTREITTLGRGGSDITAIALAAALDASVCEIYTDVDGVYTADPRVVPSARKIAAISSEEMLELAACGAKVLHARCVEYARRFGVTLHVRSSFTPDEGTRVVPGPVVVAPGVIGRSLEKPIISAVAVERSSAKITVTGVPHVPGAAARLCEVIAGANTSIDMIVQSASAAGAGRTDITFTLPAEDGHAVLDALIDARNSLGFASLHYDDQIGKLSLSGFGMRLDAGVFFRFADALADAGINIELISTSEFNISVVTRASLLDQAVRAVNHAFGWSTDPAPELTSTIGSERSASDSRAMTVQ